MKKDKFYFGIFNYWDILDKEVRDAIRTDLAECNDLEPEDISDERIDECFMDNLYDEQCNLDIDIDGYIIAFGTLGLWNGHPIGYKEVGSNIKDIFNTCIDCDSEWYADKYNVRQNASHHDGTHHLVFRYVEGREQMERIFERIYDGSISDEKSLFRATKSIRPFVARAYGWKQYGRQK